jgi:hypothetical protein
VVFSPMTSTFDDLDSVVDMVISSVGLLEPDLLTPIMALDMCSFQSILLPSSEDLLEAMIKFCPLHSFLPEHYPLGIHDQEEATSIVLLLYGKLFKK